MACNTLQIGQILHSLDVAGDATVSGVIVERGWKPAKHVSVYAFVPPKCGRRRLDVVGVAGECSGTDREPGLAKVKFAIPGRVAM